MRTMTKKTTKTRVKTTTLTPLEEKVVRMRHGLRAPDNLAIEYMGQDNPELAAQLAEIEERAIKAVGARNNPTKRKILKSLRNKK